MLDQSIVKLCLIVHLIAAWIAIYRILSDDFFTERPLLNAKRGFLAMPGRGQLKKCQKETKRESNKKRTRLKSSHQQITKCPMFIFPQKNTRLWFPFI